MAKTLPLSEVKTRLPELVAGVDENVGNGVRNRFETRW